MAPAEKVFRAPAEILKHQAEIVFVADFLEDPLGLRNNFRADSVTGDYRDRKRLHDSGFNCSMRRYACRMLTGSA
jgi:hypothetical protein